MTFDEYDGKRYSLDDEQKVDARQALGCGLSVQPAAQHFGLSESELRTEPGMPQWKFETPDDRQRTLFDTWGGRYKAALVKLSDDARGLYWEYVNTTGTEQAGLMRLQWAATGRASSRSLP